MTLKDLVARERLGGESNPDSLFSKFAGSSQKLDDEYDMDDMVVSKLGNKADKARDATKERNAAVAGNTSLLLCSITINFYTFSFPSLPYT
jgi:hypothetical protein